MKAWAQHQFPQLARIVFVAAMLQTLLAGAILFGTHLYWAVSSSLALIVGQ